MIESLKNEPNYGKILKYINGENTDTQELIKAIQGFKNSINISFISNLCRTENPVELLAEIWKTLFHLVSNTDATVKISIFNTFGSIIFFLCPFLSVKVINSFLKSIQNIEEAQSVPISVIACYCHLTKHVSLVHKNEFYASLPIIEFFGKGIENDIKYLPFLLSSMEGNNEFNLVIFKTLAKNFKDNVSSYLIKSLYELVKMSPEILDCDAQLLDDKKYNKLALHLFSMILSDKELEKIVKKESLLKLSAIANDFLFEEPAVFNNFEQACNVIAHLQFHGITDERTKAIFEKEIPDFLKVFTLKLGDNVDDVIPTGKESSSILIAKIDALSYFIRKKNEENVVFEGLNALSKYLKDNGEIFSHATEALTVVFPYVTEKAFDDERTKEIVANILEEVLNKKKINWVNEASICQLLSIIEREKGNALINNFSVRRIRKILPLCLSKQKNLKRKAIDCLKNVIIASECQYVIDFIIYSDLFDSHTFTCCLELVNELGNIFNYKNFLPLKSLFIESFFMTSSISASASLLTYLNNLNESCPEIVDRVIDMFSKIYKSFTGSESGLLSPIESFDLPPFGELVETDILTEQCNENNAYIYAMKQAFIFMTRLEKVPENLLKTAFKLINVFPEECFALFKRFPKESMEVTPKIIEVLIKTQSISTASKAADLAAALGVKDEKTTKCILQFLDERIENGEYLSYFYNFCGNEVIKNIKDLDSSNCCLFNFLTDSALTGVKVEGGIIAILRSLKFKDWPLHNKKFKEYLDLHISELAPVKSVTVNELDDAHNRFIGEHPESFECTTTGRFSYNRPKLNIVVESDTESVSSITPSIVENEIIDDECLLENFCKFSTLKLEKVMFNTICELLASHKMYSSMFSLAQKQERKIPENLLEAASFSPDDLILAAKYYVESKKKSPAIKEKFKILAQEIKNPILTMKKDKRAEALVEFVPRPSLETFMNNFIPDPKHIKAIMYFVNKHGHIPDREVELIKFCMSKESYNDPYDLVWVLRYVRSYAAFRLSLPEGIEEKLLSIKTTAQINEVKGIISYIPCPKFVSQINGKCLHTLLVEGEALTCAAEADNVNWCIKTGVPSFICPTIRAFKSLSNARNENVFYYTYWNLVLAVRDSTNFIVLDEYSRLLFFIESNEYKPKQYNQYMKPAAIEQIKKLKNTAEKELFEGLFKEVLKPEEEPKTNIMSIANDFFVSGIKFGDIDIAKETMSEMGNMGAAYFIIGLADSSKAHFFELYATLAKIMRRMSRDECSAFKTISSSQIIPKLKNKEKAHSLSLLVEGSRKSRMLGSEEASKIDSCML